MCIGTARLFGILWLAISILGAVPRALSAEPLVIGGTGGALGTMRHLIDAYRALHPDRPVTLLPSLGTGGGVRALSDGQLDLALAARPLTESEQALGLRVLRYARTPLVFIAQETIPERGLTTETLIEIYRGTRVNWSDGRRCRPVLRAANDVDTQILREFDADLAAALDAALQRPDLTITLTAQENVLAIERIPGAFGYGAHAQVLSEAPHLKILRFNDVEPTLETLASGRYPLAVVFSLVAAADPEDDVRHFIEFVFSTPGSAIIEADGGLAVTPAP
ncbi:PstS family phosphate ABC transporter substrate-binding protein [Thiocystis violascens]|uniref:Phosphate ABC transporter substrate-binding protein, PhoT family n=1 Tax=Thiocystis violascens (strain ATCC 17096 / DSM 198 / 6111) TaxID=765911 RepID=I3YG12_THIV6|nr:substrate-binding domain-containing protein [Thiocystis violascens]AFL75930.1 phosphate ABC transporter substrate-binding protein, PhoT family [Thiocystis violascens DSM 198]